MRRLALAILLLLVAAGCAAPAGEEPAATAAAPEVTIDAARPEPTFGEIALGPAAEADAAATLLAPPQLRVGEWWKIHMSSPLDGNEATFVRVLAAIDGDTYLFGMPHEGWYKEAVVYHVPFFGDVAREDLSGHAHDVHFQPLKFPLTDDATWVTQYENPPDITASVKTDPAAQTADVVFTDPDGVEQVKLTYDAKQHEIVKFEQATIHYEVVEHGYGFEGWVTIPRGEDLVFLHGRAVGAVGITPSGAAPNPTPQDVVEVAGGFNRISFILATFPFAPQPALAPVAGAGAHAIKATDPAGTSYEVSDVPRAPGGIHVEFFEARDPDGAWTLDYTNVGPGIAFIEGIAYHQYDINVPTGERRADHSHEVIR